MSTKDLSKKNRFIKATTAVVLTASTAVGALPLGVEASGFSDVKPTHYFYDAVMSLTERGIIKGYSDGTFRPNQYVTRGQAAKIIAGVLKLDTVNVTNPNLKDVPTTHPYYGEIAALKAAGIINGFPDGTFKSGAPIERNQIAKILSIALNLEAKNEDGLPFTDVSKGYKSYIAALYDNGITTGTTATTFGGKRPVMRGQLAAFIGRAEKIAPTPVEKVTIEIIEVKGTKLITATGEYEITPDLQKYLNEVNSDALKGAIVEAQVEGKMLTEVRSLMLNQSGTADKALVFNGGNAEIAGDLTVNGDYVEVQNFVVKGDVTITDAAVTSLKLTNVTINGSTKVATVKSNVTASLKTVANTTSRLTITITDSQLPSLQVSRPGITIISDSQLAAVEVDDSVSDITLNANVGSLTISTANQFSLAGNGSIEAITIKGDIDGQPVNINWTGTITNLETDVPIRFVGDISNLTITNLVIPFNKTVEDMFVTEDGKLPNIESVIYPDGTPIVKEPGDGDGGTTPDPNPGDGDGGTTPGPNPGDGGGGTTPGPNPGDGGGGTQPGPGNGGTTPPAFVESSYSISNTIAQLGIIATGTPVSNSPSVAVAVIEGKNIKITGKSAGEATLKLKNSNNEEATVTVTVASGTVTLKVITPFYKNTTEKLLNTFEVLGLINALKTSTSDVVDVKFEDGAVHFTAKKPGTATIIISNEKSHSAKVNISVASNGKLTIDTIQKYKPTITNSITLQQLGLTKQTNLTFTTDNVATVTTSGDSLVLSPIWEGTTVLEVKDGEKLAKIEVEVSPLGQIKVREIPFKLEEKIVTGDTANIGFTAPTKVTVSSGDAVTATVDAGNIMLKAVKPGTAIIIVKDALGRTSIMEATVLGNGQLQYKTVNKYENKSVEAPNLNVIATKLNFQATTADVAMTSSDVASAITSGDSLIITAKAPGETTITASDNLGRTAEVKVKVEENGELKIVKVTSYHNPSVLYLADDYSFFTNPIVVTSTNDVATAQFKTNHSSGDTIEIKAGIDGEAKITLVDTRGREMVYHVEVSNGVITTKNTVYYIEGDTKEIANTVGKFGFKATEIENDTSAFATVEFIDNDNKIRITAVNPGTVPITVKDKDNRTATFNVIVDAHGNIENIDIEKYIAKTESVKNDLDTLGIKAIGGFGSTPDIVDVLVLPDKITITALKPGRTDVILTNSQGMHAIVELQVNPDGSISIMDPIKYIEGVEYVPYSSLGPIGNSPEITSVANEYFTTTTQVEAANIMIIGKKAGKATITVKGLNNRQAAIDVKVSSTGKVTIEDIREYAFREKVLILNEFKSLTSINDATSSNVQTVKAERNKDGNLSLTSVNPGSAVVTVYGPNNVEVKVRVTVNAYGEIDSKVLENIGEKNSLTLNDEETLGLNGEFAFFATDDTAATAYNGLLSAIASNDTVLVEVKAGTIDITPLKVGSTAVYITDAEGRLAKLDINVSTNGDVALTNIKMFKRQVLDIPNINSTFNLDSTGEIQVKYASINNLTSIESLPTTTTTVDITKANDEIQITPKAPGATYVYLTDKHKRTATFKVNVDRWGKITTSDMVKYNVPTTTIDVSYVVTSIDAVSVDVENINLLNPSRITAQLTTGATATLELKPNGEGAGEALLRLKDKDGREAIVLVKISSDDKITYEIKAYKHSQIASISASDLGLTFLTFDESNIVLNILSGAKSDIASVTIDSAGLKFKSKKPGEIVLQVIDKENRTAKVTLNVKANGEFDEVIEVKEYSNEETFENNDRDNLGIIGENDFDYSTADVATAEIIGDKVKIKANKPGTTIITVKNNPIRIAKIKVIVDDYGKISSEVTERYEANPLTSPMSLYGVIATTIDSSDINVATANIDGDNINIAPLADGDTIITLMDNDGRKAIIPVKVTSQDKVIINTAGVVKYEDETYNEYTNTEDGVRSFINGRNVDLFVGFEGTTINSSNEDVLEAILTTLDNTNIVQMIAKKPGQTVVTVKNGVGRTATITVKVTEHGKVEVQNVVKFKPQKLNLLDRYIAYNHILQDARSSTPDVLKVTVLNDKKNVTLESNAPGKSVVTFEDSDGKEVMQEFIVTETGEITYGEFTDFKLTPYNSIDIATLGIEAVGVPDVHDQTVSLAEIVNGKIVITPLKHNATTEITLKDSNNREAKINVSVNGNGKVSTTITEYVAPKLELRGAMVNLDSIDTVVKVSTNDVASIVKNTKTDKYEITGLKEGSEVFEVTDADGKVITFSILVNENVSTTSIDSSSIKVLKPSFTIVDTKETSNDVITITFSDSIDNQLNDFVLKQNGATISTHEPELNANRLKIVLQPGDYQIANEFTIEGLKMPGSEESFEIRFTTNQN